MFPARKLDCAPERLTLNLSKEGAKSSQMVAEGHIAFLPDLSLEPHQTGLNSKLTSQIV